MIPKSVSVSTRIVALAAVMLIPAWGLALEERNGQLYADPNRELCPDGRVCIVEYSVKTPCEQRMREAMKLLDDLVVHACSETMARPKDLLGPAKWKQWKQTITDCVEGR